MTTAPGALYPPAGGWTTDDLDAMPDDGHRRELLDGALISRPTPRHLWPAATTSARSPHSMIA